MLPYIALCITGLQQVCTPTYGLVDI